MDRSTLFLSVLVTTALVAACSSPEKDGFDAGSGSGGASATGGSGSGGRTESGGSTGSGGERASGGVSGSGGGRTGGSTGNGTGGAAGGGGSGGATAGGGTSGTAGGRGNGGQSGGPGAGGAAGGSAAAYDPCPTNGNPCKVLPLGDSITYGLITVTADQASSDPSINGKDSHGGYRVELFSDAVAAGKKLTFVGSQMNGPTTAASMPFPKSHEGWSGYTIAQIQGKAANDLTVGPHIILVHAGTNDTYMSDPSGAPARLSTLVDYLTTNFPDALVVVAKIIPYPAEPSNVDLINQSIPAMVQSKVSAGKHVVVADLNTGFNKSTMLSGDGVHPNQSGYNWMGDTWYATIGNLLH